MMKKSFWYNSDQNGDLLKPRTGHGQYVVDIENMLFAISGLSNCTVSTYRVFLQCTMCTLFSLMPLYLLWPCIRYQSGRSCAGARVAPAEKFGLGRKFQAPIYAILSQIKICRDLRTFWRSLGKKSAFLGQKQCFLGKKCTITWYILHISLS